ncbi:hypothetical protein HanIR_Chr01g0040431 [Helianthus annuus]|nr:hypothetical protein HanIR_Chr01g0040431 [Helianthus annuus]
MTQCLYSRINCIYLRIQHIIIFQICIGINRPFIWFKKNVFQLHVVWITFVCKIRIRINEKGRVNLSMKVKNRLYVLNHVFLKRPLRRWERSS